MAVPDPVAPHIFRFVGDSLSNLADGYIGEATGKLVGVLTPVATTGVVMFIIIYGILTMMGKVQAPIQDFFVKSLKIGFVAAIALSASAYSEFVMVPIRAIETGLVEAMTPGGAGGATSTYEALDMAIGKANALTVYCWAQGSKESLMTNPGGFLGWFASGILISIGTIIFFVLGGALVVVAKFTLALMLAIGPLFVMMLMWAPTAQFFDRWLNETLTHVLTIVLMSAVFGMGIQIFNAMIVQTKADQWSSPMFQALQILFILIILGILAYQVGQRASGLAGGAALAAIKLGQVVQGVVAPGRAMTAAAQTLNPVSNRLDPKTGLQTSSSRLEHMAMGRTALNHGYKNAVMDRMRESWGAKNSVRRR